MVLTAALLTVLVSACSGGNNSTASTGTGTVQSQMLTWDSGTWNDNNWD